MVLNLAGCYDHPLTIGASRDVDIRLLGVWQYHHKNEVGTYTFSRKGGREYFIENVEVGKKPNYLRAYFSTIDGVDILNAQEFGKGSYYFATYHFTPKGELVLCSIDLDAEGNAPSFVLRREISSKLAEGRLKTSPLTLTRMKRR